MTDKQITVPVPEERVPSFFATFAKWLAEGDESSALDEEERSDLEEWDAHAQKDATWLYGKLSAAAREVFDYLIDRPGEAVSATALAETLVIKNGAMGLAGRLAWPGRWCWNSLPSGTQRPMPIQWDRAPSGASTYQMTKPIADLFAKARDRTSSE